MAWWVTVVHQCQSSCTSLLFSRVGQFSCFTALVTHSSSFVYVLVTKRTALRWTCFSHDFWYTLYGSHKVQPYSNAGLTGDL